MTLFSSSISSLERALDYSATKQKVISQNISNADTPNYKAKDVQFGKIFDEQLASVTAKRTNPRHFEFKTHNASAAININRGASYNHNGNSVDIDKEMSDLATNQIYYNAVADRLSGKFESLKTVIRGGK
ncbi:flagellar basal body rod protein FlgB [Peribacillus alkalitolerans]|uniref:flagellar basal body rod protein FlgB n=1 Tax=Peribacillus alkalitolerans TaxID=1550385 RepID=UPI0013D52B13|nr:flagellar basal body rod protein FlgB [Peribacillus alkalitolerans]